MIASEDVRRVAFDRTMRGYRCEDVDDYLKQVADSMDELAANNDEMQKKLVILAQRIDQYRADEDALSTSMINAQRLGENVIREAKQKAAEIIRAANIRAEDREQRARDEVELAQQELVALKKEADTFKKKLMELYREHIEVIAKIPSYPEEPSTQDAPETPEAEREPIPSPAAVPDSGNEPEPEEKTQVQAEPEEETETPEPEYPEYEETAEVYTEDPESQPEQESAPAPAQEESAQNTDTEKVDTVEFAFAPKPAAKSTRRNSSAAESRFQPGAGLYENTEAPTEKKSSSRGRGSSGRSAAKSGKKAKTSTAQQTSDFDSFADLDYDV